MFGGQVGVALAGLISVKILTHLLSPYEYGRFSIASTVILLIGVNLFGPLGQGVMRYWSFVQNQSQLAEYIRVSRKYIAKLIYLSLLSSMLVGILLFFFRRQDWIGIIALALICGSFTGWLSTRLSILVAARKRRHVSIVNVLTAFGKPVAAGMLILMIAHHASIAILGFLSVSCLSAVAAEAIFKKTVEDRRSQLANTGNSPEHNLGRAILHFSTPFFVWSIFAWAHQSCDRWALLTFQGADTVGAYSVIAQLAYYPLVFGSGFLSNLFIPIAYQRAGALESNKGIIAGNRVLIAMVSLYLIGAGVLILIFYLFHRQLVLVISNSQYAEFSSLLPMLTAAWSLYYFGQILSGFGFLANRPHVYVFPIVCCGVLATAGTFALASKFGMIGIIWALGITGFIYAAWCLILAQKLLVSHARS